MPKVKTNYDDSVYTVTEHTHEDEIAKFVCYSCNPFEVMLTLENLGNRQQNT